jgi:hypothetical protein
LYSLNSTSGYNISTSSLKSLARGEEWHAITAIFVATVAIMPRRESAWNGKAQHLPPRNRTHRR